MARPILYGRLKRIAHISFQCSEWTNILKLMKKHKMTLSPGDVVALISATGKQIIYVYAFDKLSYLDGHDEEQMTEVLTSVRHRITGNGSWNPLMLVDYARQSGVELIGLKGFKEHYEARA